jgi:hypothetical protein
VFNSLQEGDTEERASDGENESKVVKGAGERRKFNALQRKNDGKNGY